MQKVGVIGLGKMGSPIAKRFQKVLYPIAVYDINILKRQEFSNLGFEVYDSIEKLSAVCDIIWVMVDQKSVDNVLDNLCSCTNPGTIIIDGGNSFYEDTIRRAQNLKERKINFLDCGTSGGIWGTHNGFSLTIGGSFDNFKKIEEIFRLLAASSKSYIYTGTAGSGHYVKMIHNGIEYALMQSYSEGFWLLKDGYFKDLDLSAISSAWLHGAIIRSWLLELISEIFLYDQDLNNIKGIIGQTGTGKWTVEEAHKDNIAVPLIEQAVKIRSDSINNLEIWSNKLVAVMRHQIGGHKVNFENCPDCQNVI